jgi:hypothetical protein
MSPTYYRRRKERLHKRAMLGVAARERKRMAETFDGPDWTRVRTMIVSVWAHRDGRTVGLYVDGKHFRCGSERAVRVKLAGKMYATRKEHAA